MCIVVFGFEVGAAASLPHAHWIPKLQVVMAVCYFGFVYLLARSRIPKAIRNHKLMFKLTLNCICAKHLRCQEHTSCPCECHDHFIKRMMAWPASVAATAGHSHN